MRLVMLVLICSLGCDDSAAREVESRKYQVVSEVRHPKRGGALGTILKTVDEDTGAIIYVLVSGIYVRGIAVFGEPSKQ